MKIRVIMDSFVGEVKAGFKCWKTERFEGRRKMLGYVKSCEYGYTNDRELEILV